MDENTHTLVALFFSLDKTQRTFFLREVSVRMAQSTALEPESEPPARPVAPPDEPPTPKAPAPAANGNATQRKTKRYPPNPVYLAKLNARAKKEMAALTPPTSFRPIGRLEDIHDMPARRRALSLAQILRKGVLGTPFRMNDVLDLQQPYLKSAWAVNRALDALTQLGVLGFRNLSTRCSRARVFWCNPKWK